MTTPTLQRGRSRYEGFRATIKAIGTGPRGSRALSFDEARAAMGELLAGDVSDVQAGAFLVAMRIKGETPEELAGLAQGLRDAAPGVRAAGGRPLVACAGAYDGTTDGPHLGLAAALLAASAGAGVVVHCGDALGPKYGVTPAEVLEALGGPPRPGIEESLAMLERSGVALVHAGEALPGWRRLAALRDQVGVRGPVHSAEKLVDWLGARRFVVGHSHAPYAERICGALDLLGAERAVAVRGIEGTDVLRPGRPVAAAAGGRVELPEQLGVQVGGEPGAPAAAALTRAIAAGDEDGPAAYAAALSAGLRLAVAGLVADVAEGLAAARAAIADGRTRATLDALVA
jgi:anthranilate phosphoribosyltransferase